MKKHQVLGLVVCLTATGAFAQDSDGPQVANANTTATLINATTGTRQMNASTTASASASAAVSPRYSEENFDKRWVTEERLYREAGISEEKIKQLREITHETWAARANGEKVDFQELSRKRSAILDEDDMKKLREVRRDAINERLNRDDAKTTGAVSG